MKTYSLFIRLNELEPWTYVDTFRGAGTLWAAQQLARARGCQCKVTGADPLTAVPDVLANA